jgi:hypothetical protein
MAPNFRRSPIIVLALAIGAGAAWGEGIADTPQQDIVAVETRVPLSDSEVPELTAGTRLMDRLRGIEEILSAGVSNAARQELRLAITQIDSLRHGDTDPLPAAYRAAGEQWLPVQADRARVRLAAPDVQAPTQHRGQSASPDDLIVGARIIDWLPLAGTRTLLEATLRQLDGGQDASTRAVESVTAALASVQRTIQFTDPASLDAYYAVEAALGAGDTWRPDVREGLRRAAERLADHDGAGKLASRLQTAAGASSPEKGSLRSVANALSARIKASADKTTAQEAIPTAPGTDSEVSLDAGGAPGRGGTP